MLSFFFFFNDTATTEIYTLSLHDALPILIQNRVLPTMTDPCCDGESRLLHPRRRSPAQRKYRPRPTRSEEHTSELQSRLHLVCRLLLEKKKHQRELSLHDTSQPDQ